MPQGILVYQGYLVKMGLKVSVDWMVHLDWTELLAVRAQRESPGSQDCPVMMVSKNKSLPSKIKPVSFFWNQLQLKQRFLILIVKS